jgi:hypothetical protein
MFFLGFFAYCEPLTPWCTRARGTADTKRKAINVTQKLSHAAETKASLHEKREVYRAIARRGSVLYFAVAECAAVNPMYQVGAAVPTPCSSSPAPPPPVHFPQ